MERPINEAGAVTATIVQRARFGLGAVAVEYMNQQQATPKPVNAQREILRFTRMPSLPQAILLLLPTSPARYYGHLRHGPVLTKERRDQAMKKLRQLSVERSYYNRLHRPRLARRPSHCPVP